MESIAKLQCRHQPLSVSINHRRPSFIKPVRSLCYRASSSSFKFASIRASQNKPSSNNKVFVTQTLKPLSSIVKSTCVTVATAALFLARLHLTTKPAIAATVSPPASAVETAEESKKAEDASLDENEKAIEQQLVENPSDAEVLRALMEVKLKKRKIPEAIQIIDRLIEIEPEEDEWPLFKAQVQSFSGDFESATKGFEDILLKDPLRVEAFHGLVMAYSEEGKTLNDLEKRIEKAIEKCKKEKNMSDLRDLKLLIAQIRVMESNHTAALQVYEELVKEEPRDFRPYLCQGIVYTLLDKEDLAEKQFEKFRRLVPANHPYREFFMDNMIANKLFGEKVRRETVG